MDNLGKASKAASQQDALGETIKEARAFRDDLLRRDEHSRASMVLVRVVVILQRLQHDIPSGRERFGSLLHAAGLAEERKIDA